MEFIEKIQAWQSHAREQIELIKMDPMPKEEDTKTALVQPFINNVLGYNTANLKEVKTEFNIDGGNLKIDYAILRNGIPIILIECKKCTDNLDKRHLPQLKTYYPNIKGSESKFGILTNGVQYKFYTDIQNKNILDDEPFMELDLLNDISESAIKELEKFAKSEDIDDARSRADVLKKQKDIRIIIEKIFESSSENPDDFAYLKDFAYFIAKKAQVPFVGDRVAKEYAQLTKDAIDEYISERIKRKLEIAMDKDSKNNIKKEELEAYYIVKTILNEIADPEDIHANNSENSLTFSFEDSEYKRILCRLYLSEGSKYLSLFDMNGTEKKHQIDSIKDIYNYSDQIVSVVKPDTAKSFLFEGKIYKIKQWHEMLPEVCAIIADRNNDEFEKILEIKGNKYNYYSKDPNEFKNGKKIEGTEIYVNPCGGKWDNLHRSRRLIAKFGLPKDTIQLRD